ncbi:MAG TPA: alpha/beta fold hydrolase [Kofleriaceae bacterium]|jgi:pimeloyl-ACP methyl ester carboxylesterase|nr:alpha/beta fold hydrolase [Kofleriaceae bacterium]
MSLLRKPLALGLGALERIAPGATARLAARMYITPPKRRPMTAEERRLFDTAPKSTITFREHVMPYWSWESGSGPRVLMVHGWGVGPGLFTPMIDRLVSAGFRVSTYCGVAHFEGSVKRTTGMTLVHALRHVISEKGPFDVLIGHSLGAATIISAGKLGIQTGKIVLLSSVTDLVENTDVFGRHLGLSKSNMAQARKLIWQQYLEDCAPLGADWDEMYDSQLSIPTLLLHDRSDPVLGIHHSQRMLEKWPNSRLVLTDGLGHFKLPRDPGTLKTIVEFLQA